jgi:hypothetical protein
MKFLSQFVGESTSRITKVPGVGEEMEAACAGAREAPAIRRAAEPRRWSARMTFGTSQMGNSREGLQGIPEIPNRKSGGVQK